MKVRFKGISSYIDYLVLIVLLCLSLLVVFLRYDQTTPPFEDAAMLMRYSLNLANGHGIVWNVGEKPIDGATDFLFMVAIAVLVRAGITLEAATKGLIIFSHVILVSLTYIGLRVILGAPRWLIASASTYLALGPAGILAASYFGAPFFALLVGISWIIGVASMEAPKKWHAPAFGISTVLMGLARPEGFLVGIFMFCVLALYHESTTRRDFLRWYLGANLMLGGAYFLWRYHYFGHLFPNPYYKKGNGLYLESLRVSVRNVLWLLLPWLLIDAFLLVAPQSSARTKYKHILQLMPLVCFTGMWILISNETNNFFRYQYPALPVGLITSVSLIAAFLQSKASNIPGWLSRYKAVALAVVLLVASPLWILNASNLVTYRDGRYDVALKLRSFASRNYTMAVTEAGLLPLYSRWRAIDCWGLNDFSIAKKQHVDRETLEEEMPDLIMIHTRFDPVAKKPNHEGKWGKMVQIMYDFCMDKQYVLAAAFGETPCDLHLYFVKATCPDAERMVKLIATAEYRWYSNGAKCTNYADYFGSNPTSP
jgi:arabinofuranosyltransferase